MPTSEKQLIANRLNAEKCTGPKTEAGKKRSSQNALRHGLTGQTNIMSEQDRIHHDAFVAEMIAGYSPEGPDEIFVASSIAENAWRLNYARAIEKNMFHIGHCDGTSDRILADHDELHTAVTAAWVFRDHAHAFELLTLYEQRIHRTYMKDVEHLRKLQEARKQQRELDLETARQLTQLNEMKKLPYNPAQDGFNFSNEEITRAIDFHYRSRQAWEQAHNYLRFTDYYEMPKAA